MVGRDVTVFDHGVGDDVATDLSEYPGVNIFTGAVPSKQDIKPVTGLPSLDWTSQVLVGQFMDAVILAVESPSVARASASLVEHLSAILPLAAVRLSGEDDEVDTGMFWAPVQHHAPEHVWLRCLMTESLETVTGRRPPPKAEPKAQSGPVQSIAGSLEAH